MLKSPHLALQTSPMALEYPRKWKLTIRKQLLSNSPVMAHSIFLPNVPQFPPLNVGQLPVSPAKFGLSANFGALLFSLPYKSCLVEVLIRVNPRIKGS